MSKQSSNGPGVVTLMHVSKYHGGDQAQLILRVWYDGAATPAIEMPWMDFLYLLRSKLTPYRGDQKPENIFTLYGTQKSALGSLPTCSNPKSFRDAGSAARNWVRFVG